MTTCTIQTTEPSYRIFNIDSLEENCSEALLQLNTILQAFGQQNDSLSDKLFDWGLEWFALFPENKRISEEEVITKAKQQFSEFKKILKNPLDPQGSCVKNPYFDFEGNWVWEESDYHFYTQFSPSGPCPFNKCRFEARPHLFAKALLKWVDNSQKLLFSICEEMTAENNRNPQQQLRLYQGQAQAAVMALNFQKIEKENGLLKAEFERSILNLDQNAQRVEERLLQHRKMMDERIKEIEKNFEQVIKMRKEETQGLQSRVKQLEENGEQNGETIQWLQERIKQGAEEIKVLQEQQQQQINEMRVNNERQIAEHAANLQAQIQQGQQHTARVLSEQKILGDQRQKQLEDGFTVTKGIYQQTQNVLTTELSQVRQENAHNKALLNSVSAQVATQEATLIRQQQQQQQQDAKVAAQAQQLERLNNRIKRNKSKKDCAIQ